MDNSLSINQYQGPGCFVQALYFLFVGTWLSVLWVAVAWLLMISIIGLPLGLAMLNRLPRVITLRPPRRNLAIQYIDNHTILSGTARTEQHHFLLRAAYFLLIGWWLSGIWLFLAWSLSLTILGLPLAFMLFNAVPAVVTLHRN